jgi:hypothetical protein
MMRRKYLAAATVVAVLALSIPAMAQESATSWIHIRVDEADGAKVNVNLPMSLVEMALDIAGKEVFEGRHGPRIDIGRHHDFEIADLRRLWDELRAAGDAQFVDVVDDDEHVRVYRRGDRVHVDIDDDGQEKVRVEVPFSVVDVLLEGDGDTLNLAGAVRELARTNNGQIIQVNDGDTTVRIWIDNTNEG